MAASEEGFSSMQLVYLAPGNCRKYLKLGHGFFLPHSFHRGFN
jgi:hypothetical protein